MSKKMICLFTILSFIFCTFTVLAAEPQIEISENANISLFSGVLNTDELPVLNSIEAENIIVLENEITEPATIKTVENKLKIKDYRLRNHVDESKIELNEPEENIQAFRSGVSSRTVLPTNSEYRLDNINGKDSYSLQNQTEKTNFVGDNLGTEYIDPLTGNLVITETDLVLPGVDGLDLRIERYYSSAEAEVYNKTAGIETQPVTFIMPQDMYVVTETVTDLDTGTVTTYQYPYATWDEAYIRKSEIETRDTFDERYEYFAEITTTSAGDEITLDYYYTSELTSASYQRAKSNLGAGWSWSFPSVQVVKDNYSDANEVAYGLYYHDGKGNVLEVSQTGDNLHGDFEFKNYTGGDIEFDGVFEYMPEIGGTARIDYKVTDAEEIEYYFGPYGELRVIMDRYGNRINFDYTDKSFYGIGTFPVINSITDTVGRRVWFEYGTSEFAYGKEYETLTLTIEEPENADNELTLTYKKEMITDNDICLSKEPALVSFTNTIGQTTHYLAATIGDDEDLFTAYYFTFADKRMDSSYVYNTSGVVENCTYLLGGIVKQYSNTYYNYERCIRNLGHSGVSEAFRITERCDYDLNVNPIVNSDEYYVIENHVKNVLCYSYHSDYTGYPDYASITAIPQEMLVCETREQRNNIWKNRSYCKISDGVLLKAEATEYPLPNEKSLSITQKVMEFSGKYPLKTEIRYESGNDNYKSYIYSEYVNWGYDKAYGKPLIITKEIDADTLQNGSRENYATQYEYNNESGFLTKKIWYQDEGIPLYETYSYDSNKRLSSVTNADDVITSYSYEYIDGKVSKKTTQSENDGETLTVEEYYTSATSYAFPSTVRKIVTANGETKIDTITYTYDMLLGVITSETDTNGNTTYYEYDNLGRVTKIRYPSYLTYSNINTKDIRILPIQEINYYTARLTDYSDISSVTIPLQVQAIRKGTLYYDISDINNSLPTDEELEECGLTYVGDEINYYMGTGEHIRKQTLDTVNNTNIYLTTDYIYDDSNNTITVIDAQGNETVTYYDDLGRTIKIKDIFDNYQITEYNINRDCAGFQAMSYFVPSDNRDTKENISVNTYDRWGRCTNTKAYEAYPESYIETEYSYDIIGNVTGVIDPKGTKNNDGYTVSYTYDRLNRVKTTKNAKNELIENYYDNYGNITEQYISDSKSSKRLYVREYDGEGKLISDKDNSNNKNIYTYNNQGQLVSASDKAEKRNAYEYNELGISDSLIAEKPFVSASAKTYQYTNPYGAKEVYNYKGAYNEQENHYLLHKAETAYYTYSPTGKITRYRNEYTIDTLIDNVSFEPCISYQYDEMGNTTQIHLGYYKEELVDNEIKGTAYGNSINYEYNKNRLSKVSFFEKDVLYDFYNDGKLKSVTYPTLTDGSVLKSEYTYDGLSRLKTLVNKKGEAVLSSYSYTYDNNGNILTVAETVNGVTKNTAYTYDELNRIASVIGDKGADSYYEYDYRGNRKVNFEQTDFLSEENAEYHYDEFDKLTYAKVGDEETVIFYNENGYRYAMQENTNYPSYYSYDANGRLMSKSEPTTSENEILMYPVKQYIWGAGNVIAQVDSVDNTFHYYLYNGHGDVVQIVDIAGNIVNSYDYDVWGNFITKQETIDNPFTYFGQTYDETTGLYYLRARYYDPQTGRFTQQDPAEDGYNWYVYGNQNPILYGDINGEVAIAAAEAFLNSPIGQQMYQYIVNLASQAGVSITNYVAQNFSAIQQAANYISQYGAAAWDWTTNTAAPWLAEKAQQAGQAISDTAEKAGNWIKEKWNNATNGDPNKKPSLKNVNNKTANDIAKKNGFKDAHDFKESIVGKSNISKFNIKIDKNTGEIILESVKKGGSMIATGYYK